MQPLQTQQIYVGGTQRSGSTVCGYLLGSHPSLWATMPRELRFITDPGGLLDLVFGPRSRIDMALPSDIPTRLKRFRRHGLHALFPPTPNGFLQNLQGAWWKRTGPTGDPRGLHRGLTIADFTRAIADFEATFGSAQREAAIGLVDELMSPPTQRHGATGWVDTTPQNAENAHRLIRLNPRARVIFMIRDGRDTCASILGKPWGPDEPLAALEWWRLAAIRAHRSIQHAGALAAQTVLLEDLVLNRRDQTLHSMFDFLELSVTDEVRMFFDSRVVPERAHVGRWVHEIPRTERTRFNRRYALIHKELLDMGLQLPDPN